MRTNCPGCKYDKRRREERAELRRRKRALENQKSDKGKAPAVEQDVIPDLEDWVDSDDDDYDSEEDDEEGESDYDFDDNNIFNAIDGFMAQAQLYTSNLRKSFDEEKERQRLLGKELVAFGRGGVITRDLPRDGDVEVSGDENRASGSGAGGSSRTEASSSGLSGLSVESAAPGAYTAPKKTYSLDDCD